MAVWRSAVNTLVTALEEVLLDENGSPIAPTLPVAWGPTRGKQPACFGYLRSVPSTPPLPSTGDSSFKRKRGSVTRYREQKSQKRFNSLTARFARNLHVSDDDDALDFDDVSCASGTEDSEDVSAGAGDKELADGVGKPYETTVVDGHVASSIPRPPGRNDSAVRLSPSPSTVSLAVSSASGSTGSGSSISSGSVGLPDSGNPAWVRPARKFSKAPNGRIARRPESARSSAGWEHPHASSDPDLPSTSSPFSMSSSNYRHLQPKAKELASMPACLRLICLRRGAVPEIQQPRQACPDLSRDVAPECKAKFEQLVTQLSNRTGDSFERIRDLVDQVVKWAEIANLSNTDLPNLYPDWNNAERNIESAVQYVQVYETMLETLQSGSPASAATSLHDHIVSLHGLLLERTAVFGNLLREDGLAWKVLGFAVPDGLLEAVRRWLLAVVAEGLEMVWQVVQAFKPLDDGQTAKTIQICIRMASDVSWRAGKRDPRVALLCTDLATVYVNWCIFEFDRRFRDKRSADGTGAKARSTRKGRVVVETKIMALFEGVIKIMSQLKIVRGGSNPVSINGSGPATHHPHHHPHRHQHHNHNYRHNQHHVLNRRQGRPLPQQDFTFGLPHNPLLPAPTSATPESATVLFPLPGDALEYMTVEYPVETEQETERSTEVVRAEDGLAGALVEAGLRMCEQAASAKLRWANGTGAGGVRAGLGGTDWDRVPAPARERPARGVTGFVVIFLEFVVRFARKVLEYGEMEEDKEGRMTRIYGSLESLESAV